MRTCERSSFYLGSSKCSFMLLVNFLPKPKRTVILKLKIEQWQCLWLCCSVQINISNALTRAECRIYSTSIHFTPKEIFFLRCLLFCPFVITRVHKMWMRYAHTHSVYQFHMPHEYIHCDFPLNFRYFRCILLLLLFFAVHVSFLLPCVYIFNLNTWNFFRDKTPYSSADIESFDVLCRQ